MQRIYFDHNATSPIAPEVVEAMLPYFTERFGNPSTGHDFGKAARAGLDEARAKTARALGCESDEIVFTGGSSEANNLAVKGTAWARRERGRHIVIGSVEHPSIRNAAQWLAGEGWTVTSIGVDEHGMLRIDEMIAALRDDTVLVAAMLVQNEVGTINPVARLTEAARARGVWSLIDASQAVGKIPVRVDDLGADLCVIAAHKFYGPKGVGALYMRRGVEPVSLVHGVAHERGHRAGTENVPGIVGLGAAIELVTGKLEHYREHVGGLRDRLWEGLRVRLPEIRRNGHPSACVPNTLNVCLPGIDSTELLSRIPQLGASTGAACHWGVTEPSVVLTAMGVPREVALGAIRFSLGMYNTASEVDTVLDWITAAVREKVA
jgi:cysteine desulfurase